MSEPSNPDRIALQPLDRPTWRIHGGPWLSTEDFLPVIDAEIARSRTARYRLWARWCRLRRRPEPADTRWLLDHRDLVLRVEADHV